MALENLHPMSFLTVIPDYIFDNSFNILGGSTVCYTTALATTHYTYTHKLINYDH